LQTPVYLCLADLRFDALAMFLLMPRCMTARSPICSAPFQRESDVARHAAREVDDLNADLVSDRAQVPIPAEYISFGSPVRVFPSPAPSY
jgi:hypothetical protein